MICRMPCTAAPGCQRRTSAIEPPAYRCWNSVLCTVYRPDPSFETTLAQRGETGDDGDTRDRPGHHQQPRHRVRPEGPQAGAGAEGIATVLSAVRLGRAQPR